MKKTYSSYFVFAILLFMNVSCKKNKPKHFVASKWVAEEPVKYSYASGGNNIGVGSSTLQWEILNLDFTNGQEGAESTGTAYYGSGSKMTGNDYSSGTATPFSYDWGAWTYKDQRSSNENRYKTYTSEVPQEWRDEEKLVGELYNSSGNISIIVFSISKRSMRVGFQHNNSFNSGTINRYYSPIMTFKAE